MNKQNIVIILKSDTEKGAPGALGVSFKHKAGDQLRISVWYFPGEPYRHGSIGSKVEDGKHHSWSFWTGADIDCSLIFDAEDVSEVVIPDDPKTIAIFKDAPFNVTIKR